MESVRFDGGRGVPLRTIHDCERRLRASRQFISGAVPQNHYRRLISFLNVIGDRVQHNRRRRLTGRNSDLVGRSAQSVIASLLRGATHRIADCDRL